MTYAFRCRLHGETQDLDFAPGDAPNVIYEGEHEWVRQYGFAGVVFRGSGFYATDYKTNSSNSVMDGPD